MRLHLNWESRRACLWHTLWSRPWIQVFSKDDNTLLFFFHYTRVSNPVRCLILVPLIGLVCSIGSLGKVENEEEVRRIKVQNCTVDGAANGVRIKTWPASPPSQASDITFEDILMINVSNPIIIDQEYCPSDSCNTTSVST